MLKTNDWMMINSIIYKMYTTENFTQMRSELLRQLANALNFDTGTFYMAKELGSIELSRPVGYNCPLDKMQYYIDREQYINYCYNLLFTGRNFVYRHSDIMSESERRQTAYYKDVYEKEGWHYSIHIVLGYQGTFVGLLSGFRSKSKPDFNEDEFMVLDVLKEHLAYCLYRELSQKSPSTGWLRKVSASYNLTAKEIEILNSVLNHKDNEEICEEQYISYNTLKKHFANLYKKVGVNSRWELIQTFREKKFEGNSK